MFSQIEREVSRAEGELLTTDLILLFASFTNHALADYTLSLVETIDALRAKYGRTARLMPIVTDPGMAQLIRGRRPHNAPTIYPALGKGGRLHLEKYMKLVIKLARGERWRRAIVISHESGLLKSVATVAKNAGLEIVRKDLRPART